MNDNNWINNPALGGIDPAKLQMLTSLAEQAQKKDKSEVMPFLMALSQNGAGTSSGAASDSSAAPGASPDNSAAGGTPPNGAPSDPVSFNSEETEAIINALKAGKSPQEIKKMDKILSIMKKIKK